MYDTLRSRGQYKTIRVLSNLTHRVRAEACAGRLHCVSTGKVLGRAENRNHHSLPPRSSIRCHFHQHHSASAPQHALGAMDAERIDASQQALGYKGCELRISDHTLDDAHLETRCPLDNGRHTTPSQHSVRQPVGRLDLLPLELVSEILLALDVPTLTSFRRVNRRAMELVDSLHQYQMILKHCPNVLRAIVSVSASSFACRVLYNTLFTTRCSSCDRFGGYLYLITCSRVCYFCFTRNVDYFPLSASQATKLTGLSRGDLKGLPHVFSLPGRYTPSAKSSKGRTMLFDRRAALLLDRAGDGQRQPNDYTTREPRRFMSIISAPYFTHAGQRVDWGLHCRRCKGNTDPANHFRHQFTRDGLVAHNQQHRATGG